MAWTIKLDEEHSVDITDLSIDKLQAIADAEGVFWWDIVNQYPARTIGRFRALVDACAEHAQMPSPSSRIVSAKDFIDASEGDDAWIGQTTDIEDEPMVDGFPPTPAEPENGSSSGASGDSDGSPATSDDNVSVTS